MADSISSYQQGAIDICDVALSKYHEYALRTQSASYRDSPVEVFRQSIQRQLGPAGDWKPEWAKFLTYHAHLYLSAAVQHLQGLAVLLSYNISHLPIGPLARSVLEASGRTLWLLDFRLPLDRGGVREQVARLLLDDEENASLKKTAYYAFDHPNRAQWGDVARKAKDSIRKPSIFYPSEIQIEPRTGAITLRGQRLPGPSHFARLAGEMFGDHPTKSSGYYGYMSAMTHPTTFAFIETLDATHGDPNVIPFRTDGHFALVVACNTVRAFHNAWRAWISWTRTGILEAESVHDAHQDISRMLD